MRCPTKVHSCGFWNLDGLRAREGCLSCQQLHLALSPGFFASARPQSCAAALPGLDPAGWPVDGSQYGLCDVGAGPGVPGASCCEQNTVSVLRYFNLFP